MQKRVVVEYYSIILLNAAYASVVIESASSSIHIYIGGQLKFPSGCFAIFL
jgi:hypothetical protein